MIPRAPYRTSGDRTVVDPVRPKEPGTFIEREVRLGAVAGDHVLGPLAGAATGRCGGRGRQLYVRAERDASDCERPRAPERAVGSTPDGRPGVMHGHIEAQEARVTVSDAELRPSATHRCERAVPARVTFTRTSDKTCATAVVFASLNIRRDLPLNVPVTIEFTPDKAGEIPFACGINMLRGTVIVQKGPKGPERCGTVCAMTAEPQAPRSTSPFQEFFRTEAAGGASGRLRVPRPHRGQFRVG